MLMENQSAPLFTLNDHLGKSYGLSDFQSKYVVIYFYPKDDTPGCAREACDFRDNLAALAKENCVVLGISKDDAKSHEKFAGKYDLNFTLLSDVDFKVHEAYGARIDNKTIRSTFLIDKNGKIAKIWPNVKVDGHVAAVMKAIVDLNG
jgi:peroxiredoxin Q/BCP